MTQHCSLCGAKAIDISKAEMPFPAKPEYVLQVSTYYKPQLCKPSYDYPPLCLLCMIELLEKLVEALKK